MWFLQIRYPTGCQKCQKGGKRELLTLLALLHTRNLEELHPKCAWGTDVRLNRGEVSLCLQANEHTTSQLSQGVGEAEFLLHLILQKQGAASR